jgi:hypothetical protein
MKVVEMKSDWQWTDMSTITDVGLALGCSTSKSTRKPIESVTG